MSEFQDTFGAGANAVSVIDDLTHRKKRKPGDYLEDDEGDGVDIDPDGIPEYRTVLFESYEAVARWDALALGLPFIRTVNGNYYVMKMIGHRPTDR